MGAEIINGKIIAEQIKLELKQEINALANKNIIPGLATVLVGDNPASATYVRMKQKMCHELGIRTKSYELPSNTKEQELLALIDDLKFDNEIHGILIQLPLPEGIDERKIINSIPIDKDVDGFHPLNWGKMIKGEDTFIPCTPAGIQELLIRSGYSPEGKHVVILGRSQIVGLPLANLLLKKSKGSNATVTVCHSSTKDLVSFTRQADILIAAIGRAKFVTSDMVTEKTIVIDVGVNKIVAPETDRGYKLVGDVDFDEVSKIVRAITPVPGGVGPMTIIMLMKNTIKSAKLKFERNNFPKTMA
ncbi:MAG: bifunctional 5,10-methylene-tetrahydrofolate dehydrogenase/5,10-methylene-tetrahydrofolate cyclohydrolase [candidate division KSB1 bacterium]|nr:bifunctional 5,10-methylene-tetrahydrofolate dehydrogenase/5,10-methylene-tetrahydrofolate cyclohydrolase [candidate division KSB1 bacterium]